MENYVDDKKQTCTNCHVSLPLSEFDIKRNMHVCTTCKNCLRIKRKCYHANKIKNTCPHNQYKYYCVTCKGIKKVVQEKTIDLSDENEKEKFIQLIYTKLDQYYTSPNFKKINAEDK